MEDLLHYLNMPGNYMASPACGLLGAICYDTQLRAIVSVVLSVVSWVIAFRIIKAIFARKSGLGSVSGMSAPTIERTHAWLSFYLSILICMFFAPIVFSLLPDVVMKFFMTYASEFFARALGFLATLLIIVISFFILQGLIQGFLARRFIKGLGQ